MEFKNKYTPDLEITGENVIKIVEGLKVFHQKFNGFDVNNYLIQLEDYPEDNYYSVTFIPKPQSTTITLNEKSFEFPEKGDGPELKMYFSLDSNKLLKQYGGR